MKRILLALIQHDLAAGEGAGQAAGGAVHEEGGPVGPDDPAQVGRVRAVDMHLTIAHVTRQIHSAGDGRILGDFGQHARQVPLAMYPFVQALAAADDLDLRIDHGDRHLQGQGAGVNFGILDLADTAQIHRRGTVQVKGGIGNHLRKNRPAGEDDGRAVGSPGVHRGGGAQDVQLPLKRHPPAKKKQAGEH